MGEKIERALVTDCSDYSFNQSYLTDGRKNPRRVGVSECCNRDVRLSWRPCLLLVMIMEVDNVY